MSIVLSTAITIAFIFLTPALALRPQMLGNPWTAITVPFCSVLILTLIIMPIVELQLLGHIAVTACLYAIGLVGLIRTALYIRHQWRISRDWHLDTVVALLLAFGFTIIIGGKLTLFGFDNNDEIYSWNKWAVDFYLNREISFQFTKWPYPLLFPRLLNLEYILNGSLEAQTAVKTALVVFPFCAMSAIALGSAPQSRVRVIIVVLLLALILFATNAKSIFDDGMSDTMAASAIVVSSIMLFERRRLGISDTGRYFLTAVISCVAVLSKQPSLVWGMFTLPLLAIFPSLMGARKSRELLLLLIPAVVAGTWWLTEGSGFHQNEGPVARSMEDRDFIQQVLNSARLLLTEYIAFSVLIAWMLFSVVRNGRGSSLFVLFVLPSLAFWLLFANYDLRAGLPALLVTGLIISLNDFGLKAESHSASLERKAHSYKIPVAVCVILILLSSIQVILDFRKVRKQYDGYQYGNIAMNNFFRIFGPDAAAIHQHIRTNNDVVLWTPSNYVYGLFYGYTEVHFPKYSEGWDMKALVNELRDSNATHATTSGRLAYGPGGEVLERLVSGPCKKAFHKLNSTENRYNVSIYSIDRKVLESKPCNHFQ